MKRLVALDTETTGRNEDGTPGDHRIIEVGCVEILDRELSGRTLSLRINPERPIDPEAIGVHHITDEMVRDAPVFKAVAAQIVDFIRGSELLIHNAKFDCAFLDQEWARLGMKERTQDLAQVVDTVPLAMRLMPGHQVSLDNLCKLLGISTAARAEGHGALIDAQLLAEVYLAMTGGQEALKFDEPGAGATVVPWRRPEGATLPLMAVEPEAAVVNRRQLLELGQQRRKPAADGGSSRAGSAWDDSLDMERLQPQPDEAKAAFQARLRAQLQEEFARKFTPAERDLYARYDARLQREYDAWVKEVVG